MGTAAHSILDVLGDEERRRVVAASTRRRFGRGEVVFHQGDPGNTFHIVQRGHVKIAVSTPLGELATLTVLGRGDFFGEQALLGGAGQRTASAVALDEVQTLSLTAGEFDALRRTHPRVDDLLIDVLAQQVRRLSGQLMDARFASADQRIARQLRHLVDLYGHDGRPATIPLSQEELAHLAGTTRPTVTRFLRALGDAVEIGRGRVTVVDLDAVERAT